MSKFFKHTKDTSLKEHEIIKASTNPFLDDEDQIRTKCCPSCQHVKFYTDYYNDSAQTTGKRSYCKECYDRYESAPHRKIRRVLHGRMMTAVFSQNAKKLGTTMELIGCTPNQLRAWLEGQFTEKMNWANHGTYWHVDHNRSCAAFDLEDENEQKKCFHWPNLRPLEAKENLSKGSRSTVAQINEVKSNLEKGLPEVKEDNRGITKEMVRNLGPTPKSYKLFLEE